MNILDITPADIERQKKCIGYLELTQREKEVRRLLPNEAFDLAIISKVKSNYQLPTPTESDIIAYLKASEVAPSQWPPVVQEWAKKHQWETIWEYLSIIDRTWEKTSNLGGWSSHKHRLRADYGVKKEPEVCVWKIKGVVATGCNHFYTNAIETFKPKYCPHCGKKIEIQEGE